jgi:hypothetical protein
MSKLKFFNFYNNEITGSIPPEVGGLTKLTQMYLYSNKMSGTIRR